MKCPQCDEFVPRYSGHCPVCGLDVAPLQSLEELRAGVTAVQNAAEELSRRLAELNRAAALLQPILLDRKAVPAAHKEQTATEPTKSAERLAIEVTQSVGKEAAPRDPAPFSIPAKPYQIPISKNESAPFLNNAAELKLGQKWLMIVGVAVMVLGIGYFLKYAFDRNWIGPAGRVAMAYGTGLACLGAGEYFRRRKFDLFGLYLMGGGIAVLYFSSYAAFQIYHLIPQPGAFGLMIVVTVLAASLALLHDTMWLAVLGLIGGFLTPVVLSTGIDNQLVLMCYMALLNGGILAIAMFKRWNLLNYLGFAFTWFLFTAWFVRHFAPGKFWPTLFFCNFFFLIHAFVPYLYYFVRTARQDLRGLWITIPNAVIGFGYSYLLISRHFSTQAVAAASAGYAVIFLGMAAHLYYNCNPQNINTVVVLLAKGLLFLIITVPIFFSGHWITIFWCAQALVLLWIAVRLAQTRLRDGAMILLILVLGKFVIFDYLAIFRLNPADMYYQGGYSLRLLERIATAGLLLATLFRSARMLQAAGPLARDNKLSLPLLLNILFGVLLFVVLNVETAAFFYDHARPARFAAISVLWALFSIGLMLLGFLRNTAGLRHCSIVLFTVTVLKVFVRDMSHVSTPYRILSFLVLGLMLIGASYLYHRFKSRIIAKR